MSSSSLRVASLRKKPIGPCPLHWGLASVPWFWGGSHTDVLGGRQVEAQQINETIKTLYCDEKLSAPKIAGKLMLTDRVVYNRLAAMGIARRSPSEASYWKNTNRRHPNYIPLDNNLIKEMYLVKKLSTTEIGAQLGVSANAILVRLHNLDCPIRNHQEAMKLAGKNHPSGEKSPSWRGGRIQSSYGYILVNLPGHHRRNKSGYVMEHILVWERTHNKPLPDGWTVHHINGIKNDNRPCNLAAYPDRTHKNLLAIKSQRIRELETEINLLKRALESSQSIFYINDN